MVWFDPTSDRYFLAARLNPGGPVLGIIDGLTETFLENVGTTPGDHSVAVDPVSGEVFVPFWRQLRNRHKQHLPHRVHWGVRHALSPVHSYCLARGWSGSAA